MTDYSYIGKGKIYLDGRFIGNVSELTFSVNEEKKELPDYTSPGGGTYNSLRRITGVEMSIKAHDLSPENLAMALFGSTSAVTASAVTDEVITSNATLDTLVKTANVIDTAIAPVVTGSGGTPTYVVDTDYTVSPAGIIPLSSGAITAALALLIDYTKKAVNVIEALTTTAQEYDVLFDGLNEAQSGNLVVINAYRGKFGAAQGLGFIGDDFAEIQLTGDVLKDTSIVGAGLSQYFSIKQV